MALDTKTKLFLNASIEEVLKKQISETLNPKDRENSAEKPLSESEFLEVHKMMSEDARSAFDNYIEKLKEKTPDQVPLISKIAEVLSQSGYDPVFAESTLVNPKNGAKNVDPDPKTKTHPDPEEINRLSGENLFADFSEIGSDSEVEDLNKTIAPPLNVTSPQPDGDMLEKIETVIKNKFDDWMNTAIQKLSLVSGDDLRRIVEGLIKQSLTTRDVERIIQDSLTPDNGAIAKVLFSEAKKTNQFVEQKVRSFDDNLANVKKSILTQEEQDWFTKFPVDHLLRESKHVQLEKALRLSGWLSLRQLCLEYRNLNNGPLTRGDVEWAVSFFKLDRSHMCQMENMANQVLMLFNNLVEDLNGINNVQMRAVKNTFDLLKKLLKRLGFVDIPLYNTLKTASFAGVITPKDGAKILKEVLPRYTRFSTRTFFKQTEADEIKLAQVVVPLVSAGSTNPISSDSEDEASERDFFGNTPPRAEMKNVSGLNNLHNFRISLK